MELLSIVTLLALAQFFYFGIKVGKARGTYGIEAPATSGHEIFDRHYRVHYNTLELLVSFIPALWAFGYYLDQNYAAIIGLVYLIGRTLFSISYVKDPKSRSLGAMLSMLPCIVLILGGLGGALFSHFA